jgi:hypothetical protein
VIVFGRRQSRRRSRAVTGAALVANAIVLTTIRGDIPGLSGLDLDHFAAKLEPTDCAIRAGSLRPVLVSHDEESSSYVRVFVTHESKPPRSSGITINHDNAVNQLPELLEEGPKFFLCNWSRQEVKNVCV